MDVTVRQSRLAGSVRAPPSKSHTHRAFFCAALARGKSRLLLPLKCDDTLVTTTALSAVGATIQWKSKEAAVIGAMKLRNPSGPILCGESGTTLRFMTAVCATMPFETEISGEPSLLRRPIRDLVVALEKLGASSACQDECPPIRVKGPIKGGSIEIRGDISSQYISALLIAAPLAKTPVNIGIVGPLESKGYVSLTLEMQRKFGIKTRSKDDLTRFEIEPQEYHPSNVQIEGDWSSAAFLLVAAALSGEKIRVEGLDQASLQADRQLLNILEMMEANVRTDSNSVTMERSKLRHVEVDVSDCPDLFPAVCVLCAAADGVSTITGTRRLGLKESDRVLAMGEGLRQMGIETSNTKNSFKIHGGKPRGARVDPHHDHRIAMAFAALGLCTGGLAIRNAECVHKSYPSFWDDLRSLGAEASSS